MSEISFEFFKANQCIGQHLAKLRDAAGKRQKEVAGHLGIDPSQLSRIEKGTSERTGGELSDGQVHQYLAFLQTTAADRFLRYLGQEWKFLAKPPADHPDMGTLLEAEASMQAMESAEREMPQILQPLIGLLREKMLDSAQFLVNVEHEIAFIGKIGAGKSAAIAMLSGARLSSTGEPPGSKLKLRNDSALELGGGRTTVCEILVEEGPKVGIAAEPEPDDEIIRYVEDLASVAISEAMNQLAASEFQRPEGDSERNESPTEINRVLRNMAGLTQGNNPIDPLVELAKKYVTETSPEKRQDEPSIEKRLTDDILLKMSLGKRQGRELWYDPELGVAPMKWLKEEGQKLNNGRHPNFSLPRRIRVRLGRPLFQNAGLRVSMVDTRGIGESAIRPDLQRVLQNPSSIMVLASRFPSAPDDRVMEFWKHAHDSQIPGISERTLWMVLHHDEEALLLNRDDGSSVESLEQGCQVREYQMRPGMLKNRAEKTKSVFFNAALETPDLARNSLLERVHAVRNLSVRRLESLKEAFNSLVNDPDQAALQQSHAEVRRHLHTFVSHQSSLDRRKKIAVEKAFLERIASAHHSTIRASIKWKGRWNNLNIPLWLGEGAKDDARRRCGPVIDALNTVLDLLNNGDVYKHAHHTLEEIRASIDALRSNFLFRVQAAGEIWHHTMESDEELWSDFRSDEYRGRGFRNKVVNRLTSWFRDHDWLNGVHEARVEDAWKETFVNPLSKLADSSAESVVSSPCDDDDDVYEDPDAVIE